MTTETIVDEVDFGFCRMCGDKMVVEDVPIGEVRPKAIELVRNEYQCDRCIEGITAFNKQIWHQILQWIGPIARREHILTVIEPQNASYAVVTLRDGRSAKVFRRGESPRELSEEIDHVFRTRFPDLKKIEKVRPIAQASQ